MRHCTDMQINKHFVDTHGQSEIAFGFCHLLGFQLMPRLKNMHAQKLHPPEADASETYSNLKLILRQPIKWELIRQQYDQMIKYATALRLGTAEAEAILRRFTRTGLQHPTYAAFLELGKAIKTIFLCHYLSSPELRREVHEGLNTIENWNSANGFIFFGHEGEFQTNILEHLMFIKELTDQGRLQHGYPVGLCLVTAGRGNMIPLKEIFDQPDIMWLQFRRRLDKLEPFCRIAGHTSEEVREILAALEIVYHDPLPQLNLRQWSTAIYTWLTQPILDPTSSGRVTMDYLMKLVTTALEWSYQAGETDVKADVI
jgi:Tn3 transposase DDE domain